MKTYLIAELGSTHDGSLGNALRMVDVFAGLGASAIKLQNHAGQDLPRHMKHPPWFQGPAHESRGAYLSRTCFGSGEWLTIRQACRNRSVDLVVSPFSIAAAQEHADIVDAFKVASGMVTNHELLRELVRIGKPVHLSSGMTTLEETRDAYDILRPVIRSVLLCTSEYPARPEHWGLDEPTEGLTVNGYSDHSGGIIAPLLAVWEGAGVLEVHVTLSRELYGSDACHSLEPAQFAELVAGIKQVERARDSTVTREERVAMLVDTRKAFLHQAETKPWTDELPDGTKVTCEGWRVPK